MIRLTEIKKDKSIISCKAFVEDCEKGIVIEVDKDGNRMDNSSLPTGYESCVEHLTMARWFLKSLWDKQTVPEKKLIMWY